MYEALCLIGVKLHISPSRHWFIDPLFLYRNKLYPAPIIQDYFTLFKWGIPAGWTKIVFTHSMVYHDQGLYVICLAPVSDLWGCCVFPITMRCGCCWRIPIMNIDLLVLQTPQQSTVVRGMAGYFKVGKMFLVKMFWAGQFFAMNIHMDTIIGHFITLMSHQLHYFFPDMPSCFQVK